MAETMPGVITGYFAAQSARNFDMLVTLFVDDAVVIDERQTHRGATEIQASRNTVASVYDSTELLGLRSAGEAST